jgi:aldehyde:ferredoxin oxidoreductase
MKEVLAMMTPAQTEGLLGELTEADAAGDAEALAKLCWQLHAELGEAQALAEALQARIALIGTIAARDESGEIRVPA